MEDPNLNVHTLITLLTACAEPLSCGNCMWQKTTWVWASFPTVITTAMMETNNNKDIPGYLYPICDRRDFSQQGEDQMIVDTQQRKLTWLETGRLCCRQLCRHHTLRSPCRPFPRQHGICWRCWATTMKRKTKEKKNRGAKIQGEVWDNNNNNNDYSYDTNNQSGAQRKQTQSLKIPCSNRYAHDV